MSEQVMVKGKASELNLKTWMTFDEKCAELKRRGFDLEYIDSEDEYFECDSLEVVGSGSDLRVFHILNKEEMGDGDIYNATKSEGGTFDFVLSYYNGGCSFADALEEAVNNMEK